MNNTLLQNAFEKVLGKKPQLYGFHHIGGDDMNQSYKVLTDNGVYFLKVQDSSRLPRMFEKEVFSLNTLRETGEVDTCKPVGICDLESNSFLFLEYVESAPMPDNFWVKLGESMGHLHQHSNRYFGFIEDNFLGESVQLNNRMGNWPQFFIKNRLYPHVRTAVDKSYIDTGMIRLFEKYFKMVEVIFPEEDPSLLHGNFWKGHVMVNHEGNPCLSSPASYYGHREMDIAMTRMVGSFPTEFYDAYNSVYPLAPDWEVRLDFCKMYYHLVNLNNYGIAYLPNVEDMLYKWVK